MECVLLVQVARAVSCSLYYMLYIRRFSKSGHGRCRLSRGGTTSPSPLRSRPLSSTSPTLELKRASITCLHVILDSNFILMASCVPEAVILRRDFPVPSRNFRTLIYIRPCLLSSSDPYSFMIRQSPSHTASIHQ
jgi:hypothetical protein